MLLKAAAGVDARKVEYSEGEYSSLHKLPMEQRVAAWKAPVRRGDASAALLRFGAGGGSMAWWVEY
jgi:hypothetical protein